MPIRRRQIRWTENCIGKDTALLVVLRDVRVRAVRVCLGRLLVSQKYRLTVLNSLCSGILTGLVECSYLNGQGCVSLNAYTCINIT